MRHSRKVEWMKTSKSVEYCPHLHFIAPHKTTKCTIMTRQPTVKDLNAFRKLGTTYTYNEKTNELFDSENVLVAHGVFVNGIFKPNKK